TGPAGTESAGEPRTCIGRQTRTATAPHPFERRTTGDGRPQPSRCRVDIQRHARGYRIVLPRRGQTPAHGPDGPRAAVHRSRLLAGPQPADEADAGTAHPVGAGVAD